MRLSLPLLLLCLVTGTAAKAEIGALQTDCSIGGKRGDGSYQFIATCAGRSISPDGKFAIVQRKYTDKQPPIELQDAEGHTLAKLESLSDDMPILVDWSPNSQWFYVNHHIGSFMDELQVFEITGRTTVERPAIVNSAIKIASIRFPCLPPRMVYPNGARWTHDGNHIVLFTISAPYACSRDFSKHPGVWHPLWMIGDVRSGRIDPASIRVQSDDKPLAVPRDGIYSQN